MRTRVLRALAVLLTLLLLTACGGATKTCRQLVNTSAGTFMAGQVAVATDHSVYAPGETIQATITNHLSTGIIINNGLFTAYCPYFDLQMRVGNDWQYLSACILPTGGDTRLGNEPQRIAVGGSFTSAVRLRTDLATGTYRLQIASGGYFVTDAQGGPVGNGGMAESATFRICACSVACA